jgi:methanogenic corrinoid protein MtbC1
VWWWTTASRMLDDGSQVDLRNVVDEAIDNVESIVSVGALVEEPVVVVKATTERLELEQQRLM